MKLIKQIIRQHLSESKGNFWYLDFNPALIPDSVEFRLYMDVLQTVYPNLRWGGGQPLTGYTRFIPNKPIGCFVIHEFLTYQTMAWSTTSSTYHAKPNTNIDAREWLAKTQGFNTEDMFGSIYESFI